MSIFSIFIIAYSLNKVGKIVDDMTTKNKKFSEKMSKLKVYMRKKGIDNKL